MPKKELKGKVVSTKMNKTAVVEISVKEPHPKYGKYMTQTTRFKAHDEAETANVGDIVNIVECRPYSKEKTWLLNKVLQRSTEI